MKSLTREQLQSRKDRAVQFVRDVLDDPDRAAEIEDEDLEDDYADRRKMQLMNLGRTRRMANGGNGCTKEDLLDEFDALQRENEDLRDQLDAIADIVSGPKDDDGDYDDGGDDDER